MDHWTHVSTAVAYHCTCTFTHTVHAVSHCTPLLCGEHVLRHTITPTDLVGLTLGWQVPGTDIRQKAPLPWTVFTSLCDKKSCAHVSLIVPTLCFSHAFLSRSVSCFSASSSGSSKRESSPNDGIKRVRKMTEEETEEECGRQHFAPQHPQFLSPGKRKKKKKKKETARDGVPQVISLFSVFSSSSFPMRWSQVLLRG